MLVIRSPRRMRALSRTWRAKGLRIGFAPTMGALHAGHLSLLRRARAACDRTVVSIFVNPLQFGPKEDFARYPRPFARDAALCREAGADILYAPTAKDMYPEGFCTRMTVQGISDLLEGHFRPGFFTGVATVVFKLLNQVEPDELFMGEKDFQQTVIVRRMLLDLDREVKLVVCPTLRERDGLALSSRNAYLSPEERRHAAKLSAALRAGQAAARRRGAGPASVAAAMRRVALQISSVRIDYLQAVDARTLLAPKRLAGRLRLVGAVRIGKTRLIDNMPLICKDGAP